MAGWRFWRLHPVVPHLLYLRKWASMRLLLLLPLLVLPEGLQLLSVQLLFQRNLWPEPKTETNTQSSCCGEGEFDDKGEGEGEGESQG